MSDDPEPASILPGLALLLCGALAFALLVWAALPGAKQEPYDLIDQVLSSGPKKGYTFQKPIGR